MDVELNGEKEEETSGANVLLQAPSASREYFPAECCCLDQVTGGASENETGQFPTQSLTVLFQTPC
jgi:hypothetical protein